MCVHIHCEEVTQLPTDHNQVSTMDEGMSHQTHGITK